MSRIVKLREIVHARAGDEGNTYMGGKDRCGRRAKHPLISTPLDAIEMHRPLKAFEKARALIEKLDGVVYLGLNRA